VKAPGSSTRTFILFPLAVLAVEFFRGLDIHWWFAPLLAWGLLQYELIGRYRKRIGGGGPGMQIPPERLVTTGPYAWCRNPMYLGHLIFLIGLTLTFRSELALGFFVFSAVWFDRRVQRDEARLRERFGADYDAYARRVKRWIPFLF
jgi:protein-S-isoprenylcysteine O-methyltransferase Ste14